MTPAIRIDSREFIRDAARFSGFMKKDFGEVLNREAYFITANTIKATHKADIDKLTSELGAVATKLRQIQRGKNKGRFRKQGFIYSANSLAERIIRSRIFRNGGTQPNKEEMESLLNKFIAARRRSVAFIKSGWLTALRTFAPFAKRSRNAPGVRQFGRPKGGARAAKPTEKPRAELWNSADTGQSGAAKALETYGVPPLQLAMAQSSNALKSVMERRAKDGARKFGIKTS